MADRQPRVSVVMATYNRSNVLRFAIETVRRQTVDDWELIVVGDACTDDTEDVVRSLGDSRIRFVNLPENFGEQSRPNNVGCELARGRSIAFLNHDDLWLPHHLERCLQSLDAAGNDLSYGLSLLLNYRTTPVERRIMNVSASGEYEPHMYVAASQWVFRRELIERYGPWRAATDCHDAPSQDWLYRAWRRGASLRSVPELTLIKILGSRNCYRERHDAAHRDVFSRLTDDSEFLRRELEQMAIARAIRDEGTAVTPHLRTAFRGLLFRAGRTLRRRPHPLLNAARGWRRGTIIDRVRTYRGLSPRSERDAA